jgi:hypothetical protein
MRLTTSIPRQGTRPRYRRSLTWLMLRGHAVHPAIAQRFSALAHCRLGPARRHVRSWQKLTLRTQCRALLRRESPHVGRRIGGGPLLCLCLPEQ